MPERHHEEVLSTETRFGGRVFRVESLVETTPMCNDYRLLTNTAEITTPPGDVNPAILLHSINGAAHSRFVHKQRLCNVR